MSMRGTLLRFSASTEELVRALQENVQLGDEDLLFIENHLLMVEMACREWRRKNESVSARNP